MTQHPVGATVLGLTDTEVANPCRISTEHGVSPINEPSLIDIARQWGLIELDVVDFVMERMATNEDSTDLRKAKEQFAAIGRNERQYCEAYLVDEHLLRYWRRALDYAAADVGNRTAADVPAGIRIFRRTAKKVSERDPIGLYHASGCDVLTADIRNAIGAKWAIFESIVQEYNSFTTESNKIRLKQWSDLASEIEKHTKSSQQTSKSVPKHNVSRRPKTAAVFERAQVITSDLDDCKIVGDIWRDS